MLQNAISGDEMMPDFGKPNSTGRSSGEHVGRAKKLRSPPKGMPWRWLTRELMESPAWRLRGVNTVRLIDFLLVEDMNHAGTENGNLKATYNQLEAWGISRKYIKGSIDEAEFLGLICIEKGGYFGGKTELSLYRLTFYADRNGNPATNAWKAKTEEVIKVWRKDLVRIRKSKNKSSVPHRTPDQVHLRALDGGLSKESRQ